MMNGLKIKMNNPKKNTLFGLLKPYSGRVSALLSLALLSNGLSLIIPKIIQKGIDDYSRNIFNAKEIIFWFGAASVVIFILSYIQAVLQTFISERVAFDLRSRLSYKISLQNYHYIREHTSAQLLTNTLQIRDAVKMFISQAIVSIISSGVLVIGAAILLININLKLGLIVLIMVPVILVSFFMVFKKMKRLFRKTQGVIDWLNNVIHENILGASLVRVLNAQHSEFIKFIKASGEARNLGLSIVRLISMLVPIIVLTESLAQLSVLGIGGHYIIIGDMTLGEFAAFNSYIAILIFPLLIIGFTSNVIARAAASHQRIQHILDETIVEEGGAIETPISEGRFENFFFKIGTDKSEIYPSGKRKSYAYRANARGKPNCEICLRTLKPLKENYFDNFMKITAKNLLKNRYRFFRQYSFYLSLRKYSFNKTSDRDWKSNCYAELKNLVQSCRMAGYSDQ